jgi:hypothetical protein
MPTTPLEIKTEDILDQGLKDWEKELLSHGVALIKYVPYNGKLMRVKITPTRRQK